MKEDNLKSAIKISDKLNDIELKFKTKKKQLTNELNIKLRLMSEDEFKKFCTDTGYY